MLTFISAWRAAAIVLNDLASSAFYAGGIAEQAIGKSAPWFILAVMLFAYAVALMYVESCSMFVRGGVYRVVKEAMGGTLAKFSVSALMFDYILTGPISGVSAGQYLAGFINELLRYGHFNVTLQTNLTSAGFAAVVTIYFWWENTKGIKESSDKAALIMRFTTVLVIVMIVWSSVTLIERGAHLPPWPRPANLVFNDTALGWLRHTNLPYTIGLIGILIAFGHSVLAMSGLETLAQVYREMESPKLQNLKRTAFIVFTYSLTFTASVSFFAVMIIPDQVRKDFYDNLIGGLAMYVVGPLTARLLFHGFVVVVGVMILSGGVNTAIVGSNGVLNRVSEDGVLTEWFRRPHPRFGTSYRIINLIVALQLLTIILSRGNVIVLGEAYAFGVVWSFAMKALAVFLLRFTKSMKRGYKEPLNFRIGNTEIPFGLVLIASVLFATAIINLFTKEVATISGIAFTLIFFTLFTVSEHLSRRRATPQAELDQFNLETVPDLDPEAVGVRPDNILVVVRDYNTLYNLAPVLDRADTKWQDVVVLHIRVLERGGSGEHGLVPEQLFTLNENELFTRALNMAEAKGKTVHLAVVAATDVWDGMLRVAQGLRSFGLAVGLSPRMSAAEEARQVGLAWEGLPNPKPQIALEIYSPGGQHLVTYLGPHEPHLTPNEIDLLHRIWLDFASELGPEADLHHHDIVHFALHELQDEASDGKREQVLERLRQHLKEGRARSRTDPQGQT
jgi:amino acid transporter